MLQSDIEASIVNQTRSKFNIAFIKLLNFEVKTDKYESKVVVLPKHGQRFMIFSNKNPAKLEYNVHYLEIKSLESKSPKELKLTYGETKQLRLVSATEGDEVEGILLQIGTQLKTIFPLLPMKNIIPRIDLTPAERMDSLSKKLDSVVVNDHSACAGFTRMYACLCDLYGLSLVEEIIWDLDTIYLSHDSKTLYLRDFDHLSLRSTELPTTTRDHVPLLGALQYNEWFTGVDASNIKMTGEALTEVIKVVKRNASISEWNLASTGLKSDFIQKFSSSLSSNLTSKIVSLNLSGNLVEDRGLSYLSEAIASMVHGMQSLNLSQCSISVKGVNKLMEGISQNHIMANTLHTLNLSGNNLKGDELLPFHNFLAQPNVLQILDMSDTEAPLDPLFTALTRGSVQHLEELNVSGNPFSAKKNKDGKPSHSWKQFFSSVLVLTKLNMANTKLPAQAIKELFLGLSSNVNKPLVHLDLSCNEMRSEGGMVLGGCVADLQNVHGLDLSDNGLDAHLTDILPWFGRNGTIHHLSIGKNFSQLRNKALQQALESLVSAIQDDHCALESLSIADSKLRLDTTVVINALGSNNTLKSLDISGNQMGDIGAKMLAKALTINSTLTNVVWDRNNITSFGLRDMAQALQRNLTMLEMPLPIFDIAACVRTNPDIIHSASIQIQTCLQRNHAPKKMNYDQCYRLQQGFLVSSTQTIIDRKVRDIHVLMNSLCETDSLSTEEFTEANKLLADADKAKQILVALQTVAIKCEASPNKFTECVQQVTTTLSTSVNGQLDQARQDMLKMVGRECNTVMSFKDTESSLESGARSRGQLSQSEISSLIDRHLVNDIQSKLSHINFNVAFYIAEEVIDKIVELLQAKYQELKSMKRSITGSTVTQSESIQGDANSEFRDSLSSTMGMTYLEDTHEDRLSYMNTLKRRPQSILVRDIGDIQKDFTRNMKVDSDNDPDIDEASEDAVDAVESRNQTGSSASTTTASSAEPEIKKLPKVQGETSLVHLNKDRPRRAKKQAARRPLPQAVVASEPTEIDADATVDDFFKPAVVSQIPVVVAAPTPTAKPRGVLKSEKSETASKTEKADDSPKSKTKIRTPFGSSNKEKQDAEKKKGSRSSGTKKNLASGISNFFNKKKKPEKSVDQPDAKSAETTPTPPVRPDRASQVSSTSKPQTPSVDIPETVSVDVGKTASLERTLATESRSASTTSENTEEQDAVIRAPKKKPVGFGMPGMSGGLLAEMQAKRNTKQAALQPKAALRPAPTKVEESVTPPARPQPPAVKPTTPTSEQKKEVAVPPMRPSPPKPLAAPRDTTSTTLSSEPPATPAVKPAKPPVLRPKPPKLKPKPIPNVRPNTMMDTTSSASSHKPDENKLKAALSQGDMSEAAEFGSSEMEAADKRMIDSTHSKDSITDEIAVTLRDSKRSSSLRLSNGSVSQDKRLSSPAPQLARLEDGPVLQPPPRKVEKRISIEQTSVKEEVIEDDSGDESVV